MNSFRKIIKAIEHFGFLYLFNYAIHILKWKSSFYFLKSPIRKGDIEFDESKIAAGLSTFPTDSDLRSVLNEELIIQAIDQAEIIINNRYPFFGGEEGEMQFDDEANEHWTKYLGNNDLYQDEDIKYIWEVGRFGWVYPLIRAYILTKDDKYILDLKKKVFLFIQNNRVNLGPQWVSGQEIAVRAIVMMNIFPLLSDQLGNRDKQLLLNYIYDHIYRIPLTLNYSIAQNNNHLLVEAAALFYGGLAFTEFPQARRWQENGYKWLNWCFENQIFEDGSYIQHSTNYHRVMLQTALLVHTIADRNKIDFSQKAEQNLQKATRWILNIMDPISGEVPNLGANDGAYLLPFSVLGIRDFRSIVQEACKYWLGFTPVPEGTWDEMGMWFNSPNTDTTVKPIERDQLHPGVVKKQGENSWGYLRAVHFRSRPSHADQLHFDLWWRGLNVAMDAGTYLYNATEPWNNSLTQSHVHNTLFINNQEQMKKVSKFLYYDWATAEYLEFHQDEIDGDISIMAQHDGYNKIGVIHARSVQTKWTHRKWIITDALVRSEKEWKVENSVVHWLLPDWDWKMRDNSNLILNSPLGEIGIEVSVIESGNVSPEVSIIRAGINMYGHYAGLPIHGWYSPTYGVKQPALSLIVDIKSTNPVKIETVFQFPD